MNIDGDQSSTAGHAIRIVHLYTQALGKSPKRREKRYETVQRRSEDETKSNRLHVGDPARTIISPCF